MHILQKRLYNETHMNYSCIQRRRLDYFIVRRVKGHLIWDVYHVVLRRIKYPVSEARVRYGARCKRKFKTRYLNTHLDFT